MSLDEMSVDERSCRQKRLDFNLQGRVITFFLLFILMCESTYVSQHFAALHIKFQTLTRITLYWRHAILPICHFVQPLLGLSDSSAAVLQHFSMIIRNTNMRLLNTVYKYD